MPHGRVRPIRTRLWAALAVAALAGALCVPSAARASPPTPLATRLDDLARGRLASAGVLATPAGTDVVSSIYTIAPGADSGWRALPGTAVLAVTKGTLTVRAAKGCTATDYPAGQAAVLPAGSYLLSDAGGEPSEFAGVFTQLPQGSGKPLVDGLVAAAPAGCAGGSSQLRPVAAGAAPGEYSRGTLVPIAAYGSSHHAMSAGSIAVEAGKDVLVGSYVFQPGFSSGWATHKPAITIVTRGRITYYEAHGGGCSVSESYGPGQAYIHQGDDHVHLGANEGTEPLEAIIVWFNLPHGGNGAVVPVVGNTTDAVDFTPPPPVGCTHL